MLKLFCTILLCATIGSNSYKVSLMRMVRCYWCNDEMDAPCHKTNEMCDIAEADLEKGSYCYSQYKDGTVVARGCRSGGLSNGNKPFNKSYCALEQEESWRIDDMEVRTLCKCFAENCNGPTGCCPLVIEANEERIGNYKLQNYYTEFENEK